MKPTKTQVAEEIFNHLGEITKEQYLEFCKLYDELGLEMDEKEPDWNELFAQIEAEENK